MKLLIKFSEFLAFNPDRLGELSVTLAAKVCGQEEAYRHKERCSVQCTFAEARPVTRQTPLIVGEVWFISPSSKTAAERRTIRKQIEEALRQLQPNAEVIILDPAQDSN